MNLNAKQILGIAIVFVSVLSISTTQLTDIFGPDAAKKVVAAAIMLNGILGGTISLIGGNPTQDQQVRQVLNMPGIEGVEVNKRASPELAQLASDPSLPKITAKPSDAKAINATASANPT